MHGQPLPIATGSTALIAECCALKDRVATLDAENARLAALVEALKQELRVVVLQTYIGQKPDVEKINAALGKPTNAGQSGERE